MKKKSIIQILARSYAIEILRLLKEKPLRFVDLKELCRSNRTASARLKELEEKKLIKPVPRLIEKRAYTFYEITPLGESVLKLCEKLFEFDQK